MQRPYYQRALLPLLWKQWQMFLLLLSSQTFRVHYEMLLLSCQWRLCNYLLKASDLDQAVNTRLRGRRVGIKD
jgi:hypothetical protein